MLLVAARAAGLAVILRQPTLPPIVATAAIPPPTALFPALPEATIAAGASKGVPDAWRRPQSEQRLLNAAEDCKKRLILEHSATRLSISTCTHSLLVSYVSCQGDLTCLKWLCTGPPHAGRYTPATS